MSADRGQSACASGTGKTQRSADGDSNDSGSAKKVGCSQWFQMRPDLCSEEIKREASTFSLCDSYVL